MQKNYASDIAVPEKTQSPAAGYQHLHRHEKWFVRTCLYDMRRKNVDPEKTVDKATVNHEAYKARDKKRPWILREPTGKSCSDAKNSIEHEGFSNAIANTEHQHGQNIELSASITGGVRIDPGIDRNNQQRGDQQSDSP